MFSKNADILKFVRGEFAKYGVHELNIKKIIIRIFRLHIAFNCKIKKERKYERKWERKKEKVKEYLLLLVRTLGRTRLNKLKIHYVEFENKNIFKIYAEIWEVINKKIDICKNKLYLLSKTEFVYLKKTECTWNIYIFIFSIKKRQCF